MYSCLFSMVPGHVVGRDALGEALDDGGLADARLADQHRVVLGAPRQHLHHPFGLAQAPHHRVQLVVLRQLGEVATELIQDVRRARGLAAPATCRCLLGALAAAAVARQQLDHVLAHLGEVGPQLGEHLGGDPFTLPDESQQDVLGADVVVAQLQGLAQRQLQDLLGAGRERDVAAGQGAALADDLLDLLADPLEGDPERLQRPRRHALALVDQSPAGCARCRCSCGSAAAPLPGPARPPGEHDL